jgi:hypothetical protein
MEVFAFMYYLEPMSVKKLGLVFIFAFALNFVWENLHVHLYTNYQGEKITEWILIRATFWDAVIITALFALSLLFSKKIRPYFVAGGGLFIAILMERWALQTSRWAYKPAMPIVPFLGTGLTPTIQLALLGLLSIFAAERVLASRKAGS